MVTAEVARVAVKATARVVAVMAVEAAAAVRAAVVVVARGADYRGRAPPDVPFNLHGGHTSSVSTHTPTSHLRHGGDQVGDQVRAARRQAQESRLQGPRRGAASLSKCCLGSAPARLLHLSKARLVALAARHSKEEAQPLEFQPPPQVLERAASKAAHFTASDHSGAALRQGLAAGAGSDQGVAHEQRGTHRRSV